MERNEQPISVRVGPDIIDVGVAIDAVRRDDAGAVAAFLGTVRDHSVGRDGVTQLEYEAYQEAVEGEITRLVDVARSKWALLAAVVEHRVGALEVGEVAVVVAVSAEHRDAAFEAARFLIDELKATAPIWKKEHWEGGAEWVAGA